MDFSKISKIKVKNFNCIGEVEVDFKDSPIISLVGDNDAGKSSLIDAFGVTAYHANPNNQKDSIRDGTIGFGVIIEFEDGSSILRIKTNKSNEFKVTYADGREWYTDKIDVGAGVPLPVQEVMGCIKEEETKEFLHIRTYRDLMLFITTSAGTNYKVMYGALKAEHISKAIKNGSTEVNRLRSFKNENEVILNVLKQNFNDTKVYDIQPVINIRDRINNRRETVKDLDKAVKLNDQVKQTMSELGKYGKIVEANLDDLDEVLIDKLMTSKRYQEEWLKATNDIGRYTDVPKMQEVDLDIITKLDRAIALKNSLLESKAEARVYKELEKCVDIDTSIVGSITTAINKKNQAISEIRAYNRIKDIGDMPSELNFDIVNSISSAIAKVAGIREAIQNLHQIKAEVTEYDRLIKETGVKMSVCSNCGHDVYVE